MVFSRTQSTPQPASIVPPSLAEQPGPGVTAKAGPGVTAKACSDFTRQPELEDAVASLVEKVGQLKEAEGRDEFSDKFLSTMKAGIEDAIGRGNPVLHVLQRARIACTRLTEQHLLPAIENRTVIGLANADGFEEELVKSITSAKTDDWAPSSFRVCSYGYRLDETSFQEVVVILLSDKARPQYEPPMTPQVTVRHEYHESHRFSTPNRIGTRSPSYHDPHYTDRSHELLNQINARRDEAKVPTVSLKEGNALKVAKDMAKIMYSKDNDEPVEMTSKFRTAVPKIMSVEAGRNMILHAQCNQVAIGYWNREAHGRVCVAFVFSYFQ